MEGVGGGGGGGKGLARFGLCTLLRLTRLSLECPTTVDRRLLFMRSRSNPFNDRAFLLIKWQSYCSPRNRVSEP